MFLAKKIKVVIKVLHQENGSGTKTFIKKFPNRNYTWSPSSLNKLLMKIDQTK